MWYWKLIKNIEDGLVSRENAKKISNSRYKIKATDIKIDEKIKNFFFFTIELSIGW